MSEKKCNTVVLKPSGTGFEWCINQYNGCSHGCLYCYGRVTRRMKYADWVQPKPRKDVILNLKKDIQRLRENNLLDNVKDIFVGSVTDSYQPLELEQKLTRQVIKVLIENELPFTILTKSKLILRDIDLLKAYRWCRAGVTLASLNETFSRDLEPGTAGVSERLETITTLRSEGVSTYLSCEPILPELEFHPIGIVELTADFVDLFEFGKWSKYRYKHIPKPYWEHATDKIYITFFKDIIQYCEENRINYCIASHSEKFFEKYGLPFKPHPLVKDSL